MPNPRIQLRVPQNIYEQLPTDERDRSLFIQEAISAKLNPPTPEAEIEQLRRRVEAIERQLATNGTYLIR